MRAAVLACMLIAACHDITYEIEDPPKPAVPKGVTNIVVAPATGTPADGASLAMITLTVDTTGLGSDRRVALTTTTGTYPGNATSITVPVDETGLARAQLRAPNLATDAVVSATASGVTTYAEVSFIDALPTHVQLTSSEFLVKTGLSNSITLTMLLQRTVGTPTAGDTLTFSATAGQVTGVGQFIPPRVVAASPTVTTRFSPAALPPGPVRIFVTVTRGAAKTLRDSVDVMVVP